MNFNISMRIAKGVLRYKDKSCNPSQYLLYSLSAIHRQNEDIKMKAG